MKSNNPSDNNTSNTSNFQPTNKLGNLIRVNLEKLGKNIHKINKNNPLQQNHLVDLDLDKFYYHHQTSNDPNHYKRTKNVFDQQIPKLSKRLFRLSKIGKYSLLLDKIAPKNSLEKLLHLSLNRLATTAQAWANFDLNHDDRFHDKLDASERHALAYAIANQNRTLATIGGISNATGLIGIFIDTLWLLLVSLRSIFQIAKIYNKPLTGKVGVLIAFEILSHIDLQKLQEKQTLLAGLGILDIMADNSFEQYQRLQKHQFQHIKNNRNNNDHLSTEHDEDQLNLYQNLKQFEEIAKQLNIDLQNFNLAFLHRLLPLTAVTIGSAYNSMIIEEMLQVALRIFAPTPKITNTADATTI
ncbi:hypothetical protein MOMA_00400 [Moraxella macacae 0408225]|uniref:EcsC family protein n=1 Tax=Moraxella macacae 0408225 TaxID=1230338 RepID=L2F7R6_9GAMM|nr:EcsC family protein [Moraxella macacae]ELA08826.1 hypothetical protein MOMA_00400 [Moraxella macacae 0408225]